MSVIERCSTPHVVFLSYTGCAPNLCSGTLTLLIDNERLSFGHGKDDLPVFWSSGGACYCTDGGKKEVVLPGDWLVHETCLPDYLRPYADEIDRVINENIPHGCCGGCI